MQATQLSAERVFPAGGDRRTAVQTWLGEVLQAWEVRSPAMARWLAGAEDALALDDEIVAFAQYDAALLLFTFEIWRGGRTVYGIDDWLG